MLDGNRVKDNVRVHYLAQNFKLFILTFRAVGWRHGLQAIAGKAGTIKSSESRPPIMYAAHQKIHQFQPQLKSSWKQFFFLYSTVYCVELGPKLASVIRTYCARFTKFNLLRL